MSLPTFKDTSLTITSLGEASGDAVCTFKGVLGHRDPATVLDPFFRTLATTMATRKLQRVRFDFRELRFMNSSSFKFFIAYVKRNGVLPPGERVKIHFVLNAAFHWQEVSIHALSCFSVEEFSVEKVQVEA